jgi:hypothetical protein
MAMLNPICEKRMNLNAEPQRRQQVIALRCADAAGAFSTALFGWDKSGYLVTSTGGVD